MQLHYIQPFESASDILDLLANSEKFSARMKQMMDMEKSINDKLDRYKEITDIESIRQQALGLQASAKEVMAEADKYAAGKKEAADAYVSAQEQKIEDTHAALNVRGETIAGRELAVAKREAELTEYEAEVGKREADAVKLMDRANAGNVRAEKLQAELEAKLARINQIVAGGVNV